MKLSALVNYLHELECMSVPEITQQAMSELDKITYLTKNHQIQLGNFANSLQDSSALIKHSLDNFDNQLQALKLEIQQLISAQGQFWFQESYRLYEKEMIQESSQNILDRRLWITPETEQFFKNRLLRYNNWQHPSMIIRPGVETFINELLASDPLYLVDESYDLLKPAVNMFNEQYQQRLRQYVINERASGDYLQKLPDNQFGLVFAYHFFNFKPLEIIKQYFVEIYQKLKPGGVLVMTFNDCDREKGVILAEGHYCCYTPGFLIRELALSLGFEIVFSWHDEGPSTWIEFKKPGQFESLRGGQSLAKIIPK